MSILDPNAPIEEGKRYRMTFRVRGPAWGQEWLVNRAKEKTWDELAKAGCNVVSWQHEEDTFTVDFERGNLPVRKAAFVVAVPALIAGAITLSLLALALVVVLDKVEDITTGGGKGGGLTGALAAVGLLVVVILAVVAWRKFR